MYSTDKFQFIITSVFVFSLEKMGKRTWSFQIFCLLLLILYLPISAKLCSHYQTSMLLQFKQLFSFETRQPSGCGRLQSDSYSKMISWKEEKDCCSWDGVTCDMMTGHVTGLDLSCSRLHGSIPSDSSLFSLPHLQILNLAFNDFNYSYISPGFTRFPNLAHLNLSVSSFLGQIPAEISHLSKLVSLDLSGNSQLGLDTPVLKALVQNLTELQELVLNSVDMSYEVPSFLTNLSSLTSLDLGNCGLQGSIPQNIFRLPNLQNLILSYNKNLTSVFPKVNWSSPLRFMDLYGCNFMGSIPASLGNLSQLTYLDLSYNNFSGHIPSTLSNLQQLRHLDLSNNKFTGQIPCIFANLTQLSFLDFSNNQLNGPIPSSVSRLHSLVTIYLSYNSLNGTIPSGLFTSPLLESIDLRNNQLTGSISSSMSELVNLIDLSLSSNNLSGNVELYMFAELKNLLGLDLSHNSLSLSTVLPVNSSFPYLSMLSLSSCNISEFPDFLRTQHRLQILDLSDNQIRGGIPNWIWNVGKDTLNHLNLSHNFLTGIELLPWKNLRYLDLRSNSLKGSIPFLPPSLNFISVSNNKLSGEIPLSFCNMSSIFYVNLSNNSLNGMIPPCLANSSLWFLDMRMNNFHGSIPQTFSKGSRLTILNLNDNQLEGSVPLSLVNCSFLEVLDVGNNRINGTFPAWLGALSELQVLILRSNRFHGPITYSVTRFPFPKLRILDLSNNEFTGVLPTRYFQNFQAMMHGNNNSAEGGNMYINYGNEYYSAILTVKGVNMEMEKVLNIFTTIDLSGNKFQGRIPEVVGKLNSLKGLNFSHNKLTGLIPYSLENLTQLESLDLSSNKLAGQIPWQLTSLNFLQVLNLSQNQLVGPIPQGKQFHTFSSDSYNGNMGLCGFPLSEKCSNDEVTEPIQDREEDDTWSLFDWKMAVMGYGSGFVIGLSMGYSVFATGWPKWFVRMVERKQSRNTVIRMLIQGARGRRN